MITMGLFVWLPLCLVVGVAASYRYQRVGIGWFVLALIISPLLAGLFLLAVGPKKTPVQQQVSYTTNGPEQLEAVRLHPPADPLALPMIYAGLAIAVAIILLSIV
jgi:hypothetical protein